MTYKNEDREFVRVILWNIYLDQHKQILEQCRDGKSYSEVMRRIIDFGQQNNLQHKFKKSNGRTTRVLYKRNLGVTQNQYNWLVESFPSRKMSEGLRFIIDQYFLNNKEEN